MCDASHTQRDRSSADHAKSPRSWVSTAILCKGVKVNNYVLVKLFLPLSLSLVGGTLANTHCLAQS